MEDKYGILDKIFKSKNEEIDTKVQFKYHPNIWDLNVFEETSEENKVKCQSCNESWQGEYWLACCDDFCAYIGDVGTKELEEMGIADEVFAL